MILWLFIYAFWYLFQLEYFQPIGINITTNGNFCFSFRVFIIKHRKKAIRAERMRNL